MLLPLAAFRRRASGPAVVLACVLVLTGCGLSDRSSKADRSDAPRAHGTSGYNPRRADLRQIKSLLTRRAHAVVHRDRAAFMATVDDANTSLVHRQRVLFANLTRLRVSALSYDTDMSSMLVPAPVSGSDPTLRPEVVEQVRIPGTSTHPVSNAVQDTFVRRDGHWLVGAEADSSDEDTFETPQDRPWSGVPIAVRRVGALTVLMDASAGSAASSLARVVHDDIASDADLLGVPPEYAVLVDATTNGASHAMNSLSQVDAAAVTRGVYYTPRGDTSRARLAATLIKVNPQTVDSVLADPAILRHELTHYLLRAYSGSSPTWLVEGVAAWVQYYPDVFSSLRIPASLYRRIMHADRELPPQGLFYDDFDTDYPIGQAAVTWLVSQGGTGKLLSLMRAYRDQYQGADVDALTPRLLRQVYGLTERQVVDGAFGLVASYQH